MLAKYWKKTVNINAKSSTVIKWAVRTTCFIPLSFRLWLHLTHFLLFSTCAGTFNADLWLSVSTWSLMEDVRKLSQPCTNEFFAILESTQILQNIFFDWIIIDEWIYCFPRILIISVCTLFLCLLCAWIFDFGRTSTRNLRLWVTHLALRLITGIGGLIHTETRSRRRLTRRPRSLNWSCTK